MRKSVQREIDSAIPFRYDPMVHHKVESRNFAKRFFNKKLRRQAKAKVKEIQTKGINGVY